jgi:amino acid transporter
VTRSLRTARSAEDDEPRDTRHAERHKLTVIGGLAALSLDALASVAYGPEAIVLALAGGAGLGFTLPVTLAIAALLGVLTLSYRQVIAAFPEGGGAYGVPKRYLGRPASLVAGASLIVDYVLNVAVSVAAGVAALTAAFPELHRYPVWLCLGVLAAITAINLRGIAHSARAFIGPTVVFVGAIVAVIVAGLVRGIAAVTPETAAAQVASVQTVGILLLLKAFANGCAALTGVEAIANAVPSTIHASVACRRSCSPRANKPSWVARERSYRHLGRPAPRDQPARPCPGRGPRCHTNIG